MSESAIEVLLEQLRSGDESAASRLFCDYEPFLRGIVRRRLPTRMQSQFDSIDIVQSAWASLIDGFREARWQFPDAAHFRAFLTRVTLCRLYDRVRQVGKQTDRERPLNELENEIPVGEPRPSEHAQAESMWQLLLSSCPPEHRPVLRLRRLGFTCEEIAERIGLHPGSVRRILRLLARRVAFDKPDGSPLPCDAF
jgi:RNA polymerase sigma factor (sigma-70 family)